VEVVELTEKTLDLYLLCLEDWSDEMKEAGDHRRRWYEHARDEGLRVKLALDDSETVGGMIQYGPIETSFADGHDLHFVYCIWVHGYKEGRGNFQHRGMGTALLRAAEEDVRQLGGSGLAVWGVSVPFWMKASWFRKQGYVKVDRLGMQVLLWKPFAADAEPPKWIRQRKTPQPVPGQVTVIAFNAGWCQAQNISFERARQASEDFDDRVVFRAVDTSNQETFLEWGISDGLYIDGKEIRTGPPPSYDKLHDLIAKRLKRL